MARCRGRGPMELLAGFEPASSRSVAGRSQSLSVPLSYRSMVWRPERESNPRRRGCSAPPRHSVIWSSIGRTSESKLAPECTCESKPSPDCMAALAPEDEPASRRARDVELVCQCDLFGRLGRVGKSQARVPTLPRRLGRCTSGFRGGGRGEVRLPVCDRFLGELAVPRVGQQGLAQYAFAIVQKCTTETRLIDPVVHAAVGIHRHAIAFHEPQHIITMEFLEDGGCVLGGCRLARLQYPRVRGAVVANPGRADALITRNTELLEACGVSLG